MNVNGASSKKMVRTLALASFLNDMGSDMIYPIWPLFVTTVLGANMVMLGFIDGLGDALVSISQAVSGYFSDKLKRRKVFIWTGYLFGASSRIGYSLSSAWQHLIPFRILDRSGKMRGAPRDAIIADISTHHTRGKNFGLLRAMDNLGAVVGIMLCLLFFSILGYRILFFLAAIPSLIGVILIIIFIRERKIEGIKLYKGLTLTDLDRNFKIFLVLNSIFAFASFSYSFLLIYAKEFGFPVTMIPILYLIFNIIAFFSSYPFGKLSDRIGRKMVIAISYVLWMLMAFVLILFQNLFTILISFVLYGTYRGAFDTVQRTFVSELAPKEFRASGLGAFQMIIGLCALPASVIAGILWDKVNVFAPFYFSLCLSIISTVFLIFVKEKRINNA